MSDNNPPQSPCSKPDSKDAANCPTQSCHLENREKRIFMDVGSWGGDYRGRARTDFGLVSGKDVVLCSWINLKGEGQTPSNDKDYTGPIKQFLKGKSGRGFVIADAKAERDLIAPTSLALFIPDLHLELFRMTKCDNFKYNKNFADSSLPPEIISLEDELSDLLQLGENIGAWTIQVGDAFEMWEVFAHLIQDHRELSRKKRSSEDGAKTPMAWQPIAYGKMWREKRLVPRDDYQYSFYSTESMERQPHNFPGIDASSKEMTESDVDRLGVRIESSDDVRDHIMKKYPKIFNGNRYGPGLRFDWVRGNHDNMFENEHDKGEGYTIAQASYLPKKFRLLAPDNLVYVEHGHVCDSANNDKECYLPGKGYEITVWYTRNPEMWDDEGKTARWVSDNFSPMRPDQIRRAKDVLTENSFVRLVVMGHTHDPILIPDLY